MMLRPILVRCALLFGLMAAGAVRADIIVNLQTPGGTVFSSPTGTSVLSIDVFVTVSGAANNTIDGWQFRVDLTATGGGGATFNATTSSTAPNFPLLITDTSNFTQAISANGAAESNRRAEAANFLISGNVTATGNQGLARLSILLPQNDSGDYTLTFSTVETFGTLSTAPVNFGVNNGTFQVRSQTVPEPGTLMLAGLVGAVALGALRRRPSLAPAR
jgi:MYXO-CTERM domain-containing protein